MKRALTHDQLKATSAEFQTRVETLKAVKQMHKKMEVN